MKFLQSFTKSLVIGLLGGLICGIFLSFLFYSYIYVFIGILQTTLIITRSEVIDYTELNQGKLIVNDSEKTA